MSTIWVDVITTHGLLLRCCNYWSAMITWCHLSFVFSTGILPIRQNCNFRKIRWSLAAHDICFTKKYHSYFFMTGMWTHEILSTNKHFSVDVFFRAKLTKNSGQVGHSYNVPLLNYCVFFFFSKTQRNHSMLLIVCLFTSF